MDDKIRVSSDLSASDVPLGTRVTPRGREYTLMGLLGGWIAGGICMYLTWDMTNPALSGLKVFGAATVGSLLGTLVSWFLPSTRQRMKVIQDLKVHLAEEREAEAAAAREVVGRTAQRPRTAPRPEPASRPHSYPTAEIEPSEAQYFQSRQVYEEPRGIAYTPQEEPPPPPRRTPRIERVERPRTEGDPSALKDALEKYSTIDPDEPRR